MRQSDFIPSGSPSVRLKNAYDKKGAALENEVKKGRALENERIKVFFRAEKCRNKVTRRPGQQKM